MIRHATIEDIPALVLLGMRMHAESNYQKISFNAEKCAGLADQLITSQYGVVLVAETGGQIIGWMAGGVAPFWFSHDRMAFEYGVFIDAEHRGGSAGYRLVKAFIGWAKGHNAVEIRMGITTGVHEERTGDLYQKLGLKRTGLLYSMEV
ncbi:MULTISPECIES: GNAT family N-acetyltransferase [Brenneria]|uniref:N-acetyltransferase n=1 Tax=Brenneria nigrifluens DSM 30175 = ATCC 13028 TaxID=1121120 RepID=A0A2U1UUP9_9GAMM|nr:MULTISPECIES: GNAT family N-acetyltransferase [Brenneria]EHD22077.1 GCN5-related N-acetyltransferase [Brenneria sp. EniD312]PWC25406.1 N-acetyltransferase [Brenneria nigrifluens] [Brenneria nigrifluens DSM 30175 = ATCC 13028]QCR05156.1 GNAT family N-acetyltransferase [Brenneria nigrifluens DSM 30175 = ATCC 13028]